MSLHDIIPNEWPQRKKSFAVSPIGLIQLARLGHFIMVPESLIKDKSKANAFQKVLVLLQISWMALQCIVKRAHGFPLLLIEVHTMVHVFCAILMYAMWIKVSKPDQSTEEKETLSKATETFGYTRPSCNASKAWGTCSIHRHCLAALPQPEAAARASEKPLGNIPAARWNPNNTTISEKAHYHSR